MLMAIDFGGHQVALLDCCSLLNLYATRHLAEILGALRVRFAVAEAVVGEAGYVLHGWSRAPTVGGAGEDAAERELVDLQPLVRAGCLEVWRPESEAEYVSFVNFAAEVDDGEAVTCALALNRGAAVVTDDRKTLRVLARLAPRVAALTTSQVLRLWADSSRVDRAVLRSVLFDVQTRTRFTPGKHDPLVGWWEGIVGSPERRDVQRP